MRDRWQPSWLGLVVLLGTSTTPVCAQTVPLPSPSPAPQAASSSELQFRPKPNAPAVKDPTLPSPEIRSLLEGEKSPENNSPANPALRLRARVIAKGKPGLAIVAIGESLVTVREGDEVTIGADNVGIPLKVLKLSAAECLVELGARKQLLNLH